MSRRDASVTTSAVELPLAWTTASAARVDRDNAAAVGDAAATDAAIAEWRGALRPE